MAMPINTAKTKFAPTVPILRVADMAVAVKYYVEVLGFSNADWGHELFTSVNRDKAGIYLCQGGQGKPGTWVWIGVDDVDALHEEYAASGAKIQLPPNNYPWAYEMHVEDPDGHVLRFCAGSRNDLPIALATF